MSTISQDFRQQQQLRVAIERKHAYKNNFLVNIIGIKVINALPQYSFHSKINNKRLKIFRHNFIYCRVSYIKVRSILGKSPLNRLKIEYQITIWNWGFLVEILFYDINLISSYDVDQELVPLTTGPLIRTIHF